MEGKKILIGVCGSIAAYKSAHLVRLLVKAGAEVKVIMTETAQTFITPLTLSTLSKHPVATQFVKNEAGEWENHVELGLWADLIIVAPATANTLAQFTHGNCDNLLAATYLSARCPVAVAPAMDLDMYTHPSTQANLSQLRSYGVEIIDAEHGELASGLVGTGRMAEPEHIYEYALRHFAVQRRFDGTKVLITAGPTYEKIDPVRFIGNHSSGKMGLAIANELAAQGASVELIAGPGNYDIRSQNIRLTRVTTADEMFEATAVRYRDMDVAIFAAAVADYKPAQMASQKIKKSSESMSIELVKNRDIAGEMGKLKAAHQLNIGFALETENEQSHAQQKLEKKNFDLVVLNSLNDKGAGFSLDTNKITIFNREGKSTSFDLKTKKEVAIDLVQAIYELR
ncbi:bifunctional phosphopantothenoylcysteine decarboxylase/phosphopantothenate--cysteine ligase CoaBC [Reichenbachiella agarivorans]|uniref:Coenzyme A biosynthesis bifunctional protein CoaBC n=1 Tax=Reichenbachiella agarivorans TaxID=2979464 RepID=A0ABY6CJD8_9BACT|nr:bifunctional phosphopantothenoylcysteine decarboxylase/phosphopantothenate--cysteine ligase CoaBC [Reichenbachiella agarivorans]UXP30639.1 bifunctional phosphopantothenoylcysteine decarboxylase/phosphopantothenate--cysteine ligase CoaBC [Reichenbachiella agarivorans]